MLKLVQEVIIDSNGQTMGIYAVPEKLQEKYGGKYFLAYGVFREWWLNAHTAEEVFDNAKPLLYEGFFETQKEAYLTAMLVKASVKFNRIGSAIYNLEKMDISDFTWDT